MEQQYQYPYFIPENVALSNTKKIGVYNLRGKRLFGIFLNGLALPSDKGEKIYSYGALADVHLQYETAPSDFKTALTYLNNEVDFICICGDMTTNGTVSELNEYKNYVDTYAKIPVYAIAGNHEGYNSNILSILETYTEKPLYYSFTQGNDVFIMVGVKSNTQGSLFASGELQWLYETLEANRNKRCFVFQHVFPKTNSLGLYNNGIWGGTEATVFESLMKHYSNVTLFHGHSHLRFDLQAEYGDEANYDKNFGCHSVHISSLASPRDANDTDNGWVNVFADSEGYVVDVYENGIHLRGRDFVKGEFLPIASYWLDTTLQNIEANTYTDPTGTININAKE
jgi:predicted phosphodiesterase